MGFTRPLYPLTDILRSIESGAIQLPDYQREFAWNDAQIRSLLVAVLRGYPIGNFLALDFKNSTIDLATRTVTGAPTDVRPETLLLNGQARLMSLYTCLWGDGIVHTRDTRGKKITRRFAINVAEAIKGNEMPDGAVFALGIDEALPEGCIALSDLLTDEVTRILFAQYDRELSSKFFRRVVLTVQMFQLRVVTLDENVPLGAVGTIFEKHTGRSVFELLTARYAADTEYLSREGHVFRLDDDYAATDEVLREFPVLQSLTQNDFLQAVSLLHSSEHDQQTSALRADVLSLSLDSYLGSADRIRTALRWVPEFLADLCIFDADEVPYPAQLIALAVLRAKLGPRIDEPMVHERLRQWFWAGAIGELYAAETKARFANDVDTVPAWASGASAIVPSTMTDAMLYTSRLLSLQGDEPGVRALVALLLASGAVDWRSGETVTAENHKRLNIELAQIFTDRLAEQQGIDPAVCRGILNKAAVSARTAELMDGSTPGRWIGRVESKAHAPGAELDKMLASHCLDVEALRQSDMPKFAQHRSDCLADLVEKQTGIRVIRDADADSVFNASTRDDLCEGPVAFR